MSEYVQRMKQYLQETYSRNPFVRLLGMRIVDVEKGKALLTMPVTLNKHTNLYDIAHGGAIASLADTAMGTACATLGNRVVTLDMNINYLKGAAVQEEIRAIGNVLHNGRKTMVVEVDVQSGEGELLAKARGTFFVVGRFEGETDEPFHV